jgi:outer membrane protein
MRSPRLALAASLVALGVAVPAHAEQKLGVVDVQHAVLQTEDGIRAQATLKKLFDKRQQDLDAKQNELAKAREDIERQSRVLSRAALQRRMEDWQRRMVELQNTFVDHSNELKKKQAELTNPILKKMMAVIARTAQRGSFDMIVDKQAVPFARSDLDLTEQVIQLYNSGDAGADAKKEEPKP